MPKSQLRRNPNPAPGYRRRRVLKARPTMLSMGGGYDRKILSYGPIAYWPLRETGGTVAQCLVNPAQNGTYARDVSLMTVGAGPDGGSAPNFNGASDYVKGLFAAGVWDGAEFTVAGWAIVSAAGVWTDAVTRELMRTISFGPLQGILVRKPAANNTLYCERWGNAAMSSITYTPFSSTAWFHWAVTCSEAADEVKMYINGAQVNGTQVGLGAWTGAATGAPMIGAEDQVPNSPWSGRIARVGAWDQAFPLSTIQDWATV